MTARTAEARAVERANQAFYDAIEHSNLDELEAVVLTGPLAESVSTVHPGWPVLRGRSEVMRSYALIMANTEYIQFFLTDVEIAVDGDAALVTCTENILTGGPAEEDGSAGSLVGGLVVATNVFRRTSEGWRLWAHHGSPVLADEEDDEDGELAADDAEGAMDDVIGDVLEAVKDADDGDADDAADDDGGPDDEDTGDADGDDGEDGGEDGGEGGGTAGGTKE
ncbi:SnoaL-like domain-containing protein [Actinacidiphila yanglinensis]|uniref:SnoaL-like domain-containing protein n=1 Tax=Actinacidiphila yanglinensis TaxID=310779 RepID=A0A1H5Z4N4_9ACTN|nr:SnoaL-like domain-containing protein [Actinacidiphila yanglinensis]